MLTFGSLFSGIGALDHGLQRAGLACRWQVEIDEDCHPVLERNFPGLRRHRDIKDFHPNHEWSVDGLVGGSPCQDLSLAGKGQGLKGPKSGLWFEYARIIRLLRPRFVLLENVAQITHRGLDRVLGDLAELGLDAEWAVLPASCVGAPHVRPRFFLVAYPERDGRDGVHERIEAGRLAADPGVGGPDVPDGAAPHDPSGFFARIVARLPGARDTIGVGQWGVEPPVGRLVDGPPNRLVRAHNKAVGNAVCPQLAQLIGQRLIEVFS